MCKYSDPIDNYIAQTNIQYSIQWSLACVMCMWYTFSLLFHGEATQSHIPLAQVIQRTTWIVQSGNTFGDYREPPGEVCKEMESTCPAFPRDLSLGFWCFPWLWQSAVCNHGLPYMSHCTLQPITVNPHLMVSGIYCKSIRLIGTFAVAVQHNNDKRRLDCELPVYIHGWWHFYTAWAHLMRILKLIAEGGATQVYAIRDLVPQ